MAPRCITGIGKIVENNKGGFLLTCGGHKYHANRKLPGKNKIYWRCANKTECPGSANTQFDLTLDQEVQVTLGKRHLHDADEAAVQIHQVMHTIKKRARSRPNEQPLAIVQEALAMVENNEVLARIPQRQTILRSVNDIQNRTRPRNPRSLNEIIIASPYDRTLTGAPFLQFDSGAGEER